MAIALRPARATDDAELARIDHESWSPRNSPSLLWDRDRPFFGPPTGTDVADVIVAEDDAGAVRGYVKIASAPDGQSRITGLAVDRNARGRGLGRRLVNAAIERARERGHVRVDLKVLGSNAPAIRVYTQAGFAVSERLSGRFVLEGRSVDDLTMTREV